MNQTRATDQPTLRDRALAAARQAIRDGQWWLPPAGQEQLVDGIAAVYETDLAARLEETLTDADHHTTGAAMSAQTHPGVPELAAAHSGMAAGLHIAAAHLARGNPELVARLKERIDQADQPISKPGVGYCPHCGRGDAGPTAEAYEELRQRAEQLEDLLRIAHDTSNTSEAERARAAQRADQAEARLAQMRKACDAMAFKADDLAREAATTSNDPLHQLATGYAEAARHIAAAPFRSQPKETPDA